MSDALQCVSVLLCVVLTFVVHVFFGHCCASMRSKILTVCVLTLFCSLIGGVLAPVLVTTLVSRRYPVLQVWSQRKTHGSDKPRTLSNPALPSSSPPSHPPVSTPPKENNVFFFRWCRKRHSVCPDRQEQKKS